MKAGKKKENPNGLASAGGNYFFPPNLLFLYKCRIYSRFILLLVIFVVFCLSFAFSKSFCLYFTIFGIVSGSFFKKSSQLQHQGIIKYQFYHFMQASLCQSTLPEQQYEIFCILKMCRNCYNAQLF